MRGHARLLALGFAAMGAAVCAPMGGVALAQGASPEPRVSTEPVALRVSDTGERDAAVTGDLRLPESSRERLPAVLILHGSAGIDGRGASYARVLHDAGIATLEIDMFQGRGRPATTRLNLPHVYGSLAFLARHPRIDPARIGVMGFSWGGILALVTTSESISQENAIERTRFAAHLGVYPVCWSHRAILAGRAYAYAPQTYARVTGRPVHLLAGDRDDYDEPEDCRRFLDELPATVLPHFALTVYPGATHGWDGVAGGAYHDVGARAGRGGIVDVVDDPDIASRSRAFAVEFFRRHLLVD